MDVQSSERRQATCDKVRDESAGLVGTAETVMVRRRLKELERIDFGILNERKQRLEAQLQSDSGISRKKWILLQAIRYLLKRSDLKHGMRLQRMGFDV